MVKVALARIEAGSGADRQADDYRDAVRIFTVFGPCRTTVKLADQTYQVQDQADRRHRLDRHQEELVRQLEGTRAARARVHVPCNMMPGRPTPTAKAGEV